MAYTKKTWQDNETITKEALNNMETGIETLDKAMPTAPGNATTAKAGLVKQMAKVDDATTVTTTDLKNKINELIAAMKTAGIMANS